MNISNTYNSLDWDFYWSLSHPAHRDLAYLLNAPCLLSTCDNFDAVDTSVFKQWFQQYKHWILLESENPDRLIDSVNTLRQYKLGLYAEDLFLYFLDHQTEYELILHDQQIFKEKQCIGAMDFIVRTPSGDVEHWEMAIKYFLQRTPSTDWIDFVGPSHVDSMHRKLTKMVDRQLKLTQRSETKDFLQKQNIPIPSVTRVLSVGRFFAGFNQPFVAPKGCDPNQPQGLWVRKVDFEKQFCGTDTLWKIRHHPRWIGPYLSTEREELSTVSEVLNSPLERERYLMLSQMTKVALGWQECARWVMVIDSWGENL